MKLMLKEELKPAVLRSWIVSWTCPVMFLSAFFEFYSAATPSKVIVILPNPVPIE